MAGVEVKVHLMEEDRTETRSLSPESSIIDLLEELNRNPESVVVKRNGKIVTEEEKVEEGDEVTIIPVVSGG